MVVMSKWRTFSLSVTVKQKCNFILWTELISLAKWEPIEFSKPTQNLNWKKTVHKWRLN
jgi:hypothetical protein